MNPSEELVARPGGGDAGRDAARQVAGAATKQLSRELGQTLGELVDAVVGFDRLIAWASAGRAQMIDQARQWSELTEQASKPETRPGWSSRERARHTLVSELACALRLPERTTENLVEHSKALMTTLPATLEALRAGEISYRHAQTLIDHAWSIPADARAGFEESVLPHARELTVAKFDTTARRVRERTHPESILARHQKSIQDRNLSFQPDQDGMAWLGSYLPASSALACYNRASDIALGLQGSAETRTLAQLRADVFADLLLEGVTAEGLGTGITAKVMVTVPVLTLLGRTEEPGALEGYGPIDPDTARRLAGTAKSFTRILTHPETGCALSIGSKHYKVPKDLRLWLRIRDETCRFPGCNRPAAHCDLDHTRAWAQGGPTDHDNLAHLCRGDHILKHQTDWTVTNARDGTLEWTSPSGHTYRTRPAIQIGQSPRPDPDLKPDQDQDQNQDQDQDQNPPPF